MFFQMTFLIIASFESWVLTSRKDGAILTGLALGSGSKMQKLKCLTFLLIELF